MIEITLPENTFNGIHTVLTEPFCFPSVTEQLCGTASCLSQVSEVRVCVEVWRAYINLVQQHCGQLMMRLDVSVPLVALTREIHDGLLLLGSVPIDNTVLVSSCIMEELSFIVGLCSKLDIHGTFG